MPLTDDYVSLRRITDTYVFISFFTHYSPNGSNRPYVLIGDIIFKLLTSAKARSREGMPPTFIEIFMTYGIQFGSLVLEVSKTVMSFAAKVGHGLYAKVGDTGSTGRSDVNVELGACVDSVYSYLEVSTEFFTY
jgi:hypothetical protein